jgi:hypothetical protein
MTKNEIRELIGRVRSNKYLMRSETDYITKALEEVQQYRAIGTVEECREAIEKQKSKKPTEQYRLGTSGRGGKCPSCKHHLDRSVCAMYCDCGQKLDWSDVE